MVLVALTHNLMRGMAISRLWGTSAAMNDKLIEHWRKLVLDGMCGKTRTRRRRGGVSSGGDKPIERTQEQTMARRSRSAPQ